MASVYMFHRFGLIFGSLHLDDRCALSVRLVRMVCVWVRSMGRLESPMSLRLLVEEGWLMPDVRYSRVRRECMFCRQNLTRCESSHNFSKGKICLVYQIHLW